MKNFAKDQFGRLRANTDLETALATYHAGDAISDAELDILIDFYRNMEGLANAAGPAYSLFWKDAFQHLNVLEGFKEARRRNK